MKTPSDELFQLIKSLRPQEKAHFKQFMTPKEKGKLLVAGLFVFDSLNKMSIYKEEKIKSEVLKKFGVSDFSKLKNSISSSIIESLLQYHSQSSFALQLNRMLSEVEILISKNLLNKAFDIIKRAKKMAEKMENFHHLQMLLEFEQIIFSALNSQRGQNSTPSTTEEQLDLGEIQENLYLHNKNRQNVFSLYVKTPKVSNREDRKRVAQGLLKGDLLSAPKSFRAEKQLLNSKALAYYFLNNPKAGHKYSSQFVELFDSKGEEFIMDDLRSYIIGLTFLLSSQNLLKKFEEVEKTYIRGKRIYNKIPSKQKSPRIENIFFAFDINYIECLMKQLNFKKAIDLGESICKKYFSRNLVEPYGLMHLLYYISVSHLYLGNYKQALSWINKSSAIGRKDENLLVFYSKILRIIIHYELKNDQLALSLTESLIVSIKKLKNLNEYDTAFLIFLKTKRPFIKSDAEERELFIAFNANLSAQARRLIKTNNNDQFLDINSWVISKMKNRSILNVLSEKQSDQ